ncbi:MAG TPA: metal-dependent transcriptional regulator [Chloroflexia bacterium]|nr:metal-dependent transcriptional regulator [Chloroflexia bacterium]
MVTRAVEDYLKAIYKLQRSGSPATTNAIADLLGIRAASVTAMFQQLSEQGMAEYTPYRGALLTDKGTEAALRVIRRHRLIELYLHQHLDVPWDRVHDEAERLEHAISPYLEERIDASLGRPHVDPHGAPIPTSAGTIEERDLIPLAELPLDTPSVVRHIPDDDPDLLRQAASLGIVPEVSVTVVGHDLDGDLNVLVEPQGEDRDNPTRKVTPGDARRVYVQRP